MPGRRRVPSEDGSLSTPRVARRRRRASRSTSGTSKRDYSNSMRRDMQRRLKEKERVTDKIKNTNREKPHTWSKT